MIKKQSLWFLTLFSLVLVLSVYYITMPNDLFSISNGEKKVESTSKEVSGTVTSIEENELLVTMRVNLDEERTEEMNNLKSTLTDENSTSEEKNNAYEQIKYITNLSVQEQSIEDKIKKEFNIDSFVKIENDQVRIVAVKENHDLNLASDIMKSVQKEFANKVSISIKFD